MAEQGICNGVVRHITQNIKIIAANGGLDLSLCFTAAETGCFCLQNVAVLNISDQLFLGLVRFLMTPAYQILIYFSSEFVAALHHNDSQLALRKILEILDSSQIFSVLHDRLCLLSVLPMIAEID